MSNEQNPRLFVGYFVGDEILPIYVGIIVNRYKDPCETTSIMESQRVFFFLTCMLSPFPVFCGKWKFIFVGIRDPKNVDSPKVYQNSTPQKIYRTWKSPNWNRKIYFQTTIFGGVQYLQWGYWCHPPIYYFTLWPPRTIVFYQPELLEHSWLVNLSPFPPEIGLLKRKQWLIIKKPLGGG